MSGPKQTGRFRAMSAKPARIAKAPPLPGSRGSAPGLLPDRPSGVDHVAALEQRARAQLATAEDS